MTNGPGRRAGKRRKCISDDLPLAPLAGATGCNRSKTPTLHRRPHQPTTTNNKPPNNPQKTHTHTPKLPPLLHSVVFLSDTCTGALFHGPLSGHPHPPHPEPLSSRTTTFPQNCPSPTKRVVTSNGVKCNQFHVIQTPWQHRFLRQKFET